MSRPAVRQIVAMGGGGVSLNPKDLVIDRYILGLAGKERPKVCFVPTANADDKDYIHSFYQAFTAEVCQPTHLSLFALPTRDLRSFLLEQDVIYVGGGNTRSMMALWREWGLDSILRDAWHQGTVLGGSSAGGMCWFEDGVTDSMPGTLQPETFLGFLKGSFCPHYSNFQPAKQDNDCAIQAGTIQAGYAADDYVALVFQDEQLTRVVSSILGANAFYMEKGDTDVVKTPLEIEHLTAATLEGASR